MQLQGFPIDSHTFAWVRRMISVCINSLSLHIASLLTVGYGLLRKIPVVCQTFSYVMWRRQLHKVYCCCLNLTINYCFFKVNSLYTVQCALSSSTCIKTTCRQFLPTILNYKQSMSNILILFLAKKWHLLFSNYSRIICQGLVSVSPLESSFHTSIFPPLTLPLSFPTTLLPLLFYSSYLPSFLSFPPSLPLSLAFTLPPFSFQVEKKEEKDFDMCMCSVAMFPKIKHLQKVLKAKMPNPRRGELVCVCLLPKPKPSSCTVQQDTAVHQT